MCNKGYDFDIEPLDYYFCGPETFFEWNFQTAINPLHRLPECTGKHIHVRKYLWTNLFINKALIVYFLL